jgi:hypothetical protein
MNLARLTEILNHHDEIARAMRASNDAFDRLMIDLLRGAATASHDANESQRVAIDALIAANRAAIALMNDDDGGRV